MAEGKEKLPRESEDKVIEVSLKHVIFAFSGLAVGSFAVGAGIVLVKDYTKYRRQKAIIEVAKEMFTFIKHGGEISEWKTKSKTGSTSKKQPSVKQSNS